jgi:hypothetical protein
MAEMVEVQAGVWWRFTAYECREGSIRPAQGATLEPYDPWQAYRAAQAGRKTRPSPYQPLLDLLDGITYRPVGEQGYPALTPESEQQVLQWCATYGLLGVLPHRVRMVVLAPRWEPLFEGLPEALWPALRQYVRTATGWSLMVSSHLSGAPGEGMPMPQGAPEARGRLVGEPDWPHGWPMPGVLLRELRGPAWRWEPLARTWGRFFPDLPTDGRETYAYPMPLTPAFWALYAEPVEAFLAGGLALREALRGLACLKPLAETSEDERQAIVGGMRVLQALVEPVGLTPRLSDEGGVHQQWAATSLLASFAAMALQDLSVKRLLGCAVCGRLFFSKAPRATYCRRTCRLTAQKRAYREKRKRKPARSLEPWA